MNILFLCVANSARSQMAEGLARALLPGDHIIQSAGSNPSQVNPYSIKVMKEIGIDITRQLSKSISSICLDNVDIVITLCAEEVCPVTTGSTQRWHWPVSDPVVKGDTEEQKLQHFREARNSIHRMLQSKFANLGTLPRPGTPV